MVEEWMLEKLVQGQPLYTRREALKIGLNSFFAFLFLPRLSSKKRLKKLYWFIPDGVPSEWFFQLAEQGALPHIRNMMRQGAYGYSIPAFPSHTPTNYATLRTGCYPEVHGVADGPIRISGQPLTMPLRGFSSVASRKPAVWTILEEEGMKPVVFSIPGSTPPELKRGITIRGRWSGWGAETPPLLFTTGKVDINTLSLAGFALTRKISPQPAQGWKNPPQYSGTPKEIKLSGHGLDFYGLLYSGSVPQYDRIMFSLDKEKPLAILREGEWSKWIPVRLRQGRVRFNSFVRIKIIRLSADAREIRIRFYFASLNRLLVEPEYAYQEITENAGPSVDYVDDWPHQLVEDIDYETFLEETEMSCQWHRKASAVILKKYHPDAFIHCIYTPNQFFESPFWMGHLDPSNKRVYDPEKREKYWQDTVRLYKGLDNIIGEYLKRADKDTIVLFSSDHGIAPLHRRVRLNNLFARKGWLKFKMNPETGKPQVDWARTKVVYLKMACVYIHPDGFGPKGYWKRATGTKYETLRNQVLELLYSLKDEDGNRPLAAALKWEEAGKWHLPKDRVGDIIISANPPYGWTEDMDKELIIFVNSRDTGYKQTVPPENKHVWSPFVITGPGVKKGYRLRNPIHHVDQLPTLLSLMGLNIPSYIQGTILKDILI